MFAGRRGHGTRYNGRSNGLLETGISGVEHEACGVHPDATDFDESVLTGLGSDVALVV